MQTYGVRGLNTIRSAQQVLVTEGLLRPEPSRGVRVIGLPVARNRARADEIIGEIRRLLADLEEVL